MKKLCLLLSLAMLLTIAACGRSAAPETTAATTAATTQTPTETTVPETTVPETTVPETTVPEVFLLAIPESIAMSGPDGKVLATITYIFEEGWQDKETFTATYGGDVALLGQQEVLITFGDKYMVTDMPGLSRIESYYDEQGRTLRQVTFPAKSADVVKTESFFTYDEFGRTLTQEQHTYAPGAEEPSVITYAYTYTDTDTGSVGTASFYTQTIELHYDADYRNVATVHFMNGQEFSRTEVVINEDGSYSSISYVNGQKASEARTTYTRVEVSAATAARLPWYLVKE